MLKKVVLIITTVFTVFLLVAVFANLGDQELDPALANVSQTPFQEVPAEYVQAYKYAIGLQAPEGQSPLEYGEKVYANFKTDAKKNKSKSDRIDLPKFDKLRCYFQEYCMGEDRMIFLAEADEYFASHKLWLDRHNELMKFGGMAFDMQPTIRNSALSASTILNLTKLKFLEIKHKIYGKKYAEALTDLAAINNFNLEVLKYKQPLLTNMVSLVILEQLRDILIKSNNEFPDFKIAYLKRESEFKKSLDFNKIVDMAVNYEVTTVYGSLFDDIAWGLSGSNWWENSMWRIGRAFFLRKNQTMNEYYSFVSEIRGHHCVTGPEACKDFKIKPHWAAFSYLQNPMGKLLVKLFSSQIVRVMEKMHIKIEELNKN